MVRELDVSMLTERIVAMERRLRRVRTAVVALLTTAACGAAAMGYAVHANRPPSPEGTIEGRRVLLRDPNGAVRAVLGVGEDGAARLDLSGDDGMPRAMLAVAADGVPALALADHAGRLRATVAVSGDGSANVDFFDAGRGLRAQFGTDGKGLPALALMDDAQRVKVLVDEHGQVADREP